MMPAGTPALPVLRLPLPAPCATARGRAGPAAVLALGSGVAVACQGAAGAGVIASAESARGIWAPVSSACESGMAGGREMEIGSCWRTDG
jgi:hypothetical protein